MSKSGQELPRGWKAVASKSRPDKVYYLHVKTGEKTWKMSHVHAKERELRHKKSSSSSSSRKPKKESSSDEAVQVGLYEYLMCVYPYHINILTTYALNVS